MYYLGKVCIKKGKIMFYSMNYLFEMILENNYSFIAAINRGDFNESDLMMIISNTLLRLGIPPNHRGYIYLREAIIIKINNPLEEMPVTKNIYPDIAKAHQVSVGSVERAIRHSIEAGWKRIHLFNQEKVPSDLFVLSIKRPQNSEFIAIIAESIVLVINNQKEAI